MSLNSHFSATSLCPVYGGEEAGLPDENPWSSEYN